MPPIRKVKIVWECPHCGKEYKSRHAARECENKPALPFAFTKGTRLVLHGRSIEAPHVFNVTGIANIEILEQLRSPSEDKHINMYVISIGEKYNYKVSEAFIKMHME